ncbi:DUF4175 domain-containing protein [Hellea balneolensis]|uniref:DUF4175 domain-containing protein n=1 Tax=Hellea balneolensis TaxID=287478 RepID=UPI00041A8EB1|nr:DUF4175 family protein [Hellea balneolensis]
MSQNPDTSSLLKRTGGYVRRAQASLYWERYAPVFALAAAIAIVFLIGAFGGIWERIGDPWRLIVLAIALFFLAKAAWRARVQKRPDLSEARRRVEGDSNIKHRPLDVLEDRPAISEAAWPAHFETARRNAENLRPARWRHALKPIDPYYLRFVLPCALGLAMMVGFGDNYERLRRSVSPTWQSAINPADVTYEAWVDPPEYTGRPPLYFKDKNKVDVPAGSELVARISGVKDAPRLKLGRKYLPLKRLGPQSFEARAILKEKSTARWRIGTKEKKWVLNVLPDTAPYVVFEELPKADKRDRLAFTYTFEDDYGIESLELKMRLLTEDPIEAAKTSVITVPLSSASVKRAEEADAALELTKHEWAGRKVAGILIAKDGLGQMDESQESFFTVPDKIFIEPMAKAIIEQRNLVIAGSGEYAPLPKTHDYRNAPYFDTYQPEFRLDRAPAQIERAAILIDALTDKPAGIFSDPAIYMGLKNVRGRLRYGRKASDLKGIPEDLWRIAIRAEFGVLGTALEEMREAKEALQDGMARRAPEREIDTLFDRYDQAVERYMEELRRQAIEEGNIADAEGGGGQGGRNADEIEELLKAIEEANKAGDTEGARKALARLAELLENMEMQLTRGGQGEGGETMPGEMSEEMKKSLEDLADLLGDQRELQDETRQAENEAEQNDQEDGSEGGNSEEDQNGEQSGQENDGEDQDNDGEDNGSEQGNGGQEQGEGALSPGELAARQGALQDALDALEGALPEEGENGGGGEESEDGQGGGGENDPDSDARGGSGEEQQDAAEALAEAGEAMRESQDRLENGDLARANDAQADAIRALRRAGESMASSGREQGRGEEGSDQAENEDPLGRENAGGNADESEADIDTRDDATRSRELREELRRRAAEQERDEAEREYLERLLKRF